MRKYKPIIFPKGKMPKVVIWTNAYNAHKTIVRTIDSVLAQTYTDFVWYILDNGSETPDTYNIIYAYAQKDKRIVPMRIKKNSASIWFVTQLFKKYKNTEAYFTTIDADDEWHCDMLEELLPFAEKNNLDIATCGVNLVDEKSGNIFRTKKLDTELVIDRSSFDEAFGIFRTYFIQKWAKLFRIGMLGEISHIALKRNKLHEYNSPLLEIPAFKRVKSTIKRHLHRGKLHLRNIIKYNLIKNGFNVCHFNMNWYDISFNMRSLKAANRIGILPKVMYNYYDVEKSRSNTFTRNFTFNKINYDIYLTDDFLSSLGEISEYNRNYLTKIFYSMFDKLLPAFKRYTFTYNDMKLKGKIKYHLKKHFIPNYLEYIDYRVKLGEIIRLFSKKPMYDFLRADCEVISDKQKADFIAEFLNIVFSDERFYTKKKSKKAIEKILTLMDLDNIPLTHPYSEQMK